MENRQRMKSSFFIALIFCYRWYSLNHRKYYLVVDIPNPNLILRFGNCVTKLLPLYSFAQSNYKLQLFENEYNLVFNRFASFFIF